MRNFVLTVYIPDETPIRDSVFVAQMLREAAATLNYQVQLQHHHHVYGPAGAHKYEWTISDPTAPIDQAQARKERNERKDRRVGRR